MRTQRFNTVRRRAQDLQQRPSRRPAAPVGETDTDAFTRDGERHRNPKGAGAGEAIAIGCDGVDFDVGDLSTEARSAKVDQLTFSSSTSKTSVAFGGMTPPAPCAP